MAIVGGTASVIGGGKFSNGAMGSAFQYLFNDVAGTIKQYGTRTLTAIGGVLQIGTGTILIGSGVGVGFGVNNITAGVTNYNVLQEGLEYVIGNEDYAKRTYAGIDLVSGLTSWAVKIPTVVKSSVFGPVYISPTVYQKTSGGQVVVESIVHANTVYGGTQ